MLQNNPNPFNKKTEIRYFIPEQAQKAMIVIYNLQGAQQKSYKIKNKGLDSITINASELMPGMYLYALIVDEREVANRKMIITD